MNARVVGVSRAGTELIAYERGGSGGLLVFGAIHGDEPDSARLCERVLAEVRAQDGPAITIAPVVNPDGLVRLHKDNGAGVDLNRNFPATSWRAEHPPGYDPGASPGSEPETAALVALLEARRPRAIIAVHQPFACVNWDGPADQIVARMCATTGLPARASIGYPTPGSFGAYAGVDGGLPTITLELARSPDEDAMVRATRAILDEWRRGA